MPTLETRWTSPLVDVTLDKSVARSSLRAGATYELVGFDGSEDGPLRPFPGFVLVHELGPTGGIDTLGANHSGTSRLIDVVPVNFRVGTTDYAYGFVYRVQVS